MNDADEAKKRAAHTYSASEPTYHGDDEVSEEEPLADEEVDEEEEEDDPEEDDEAPDEPSASAESGEEPRKRSRFESILPGLIRRGLERGIEAGMSTFERSLETGRETTDAVRERLQDVRIPKDVAAAVTKALGEAKLPRDLASAVFNQLDDTKSDVLRIVAREVRDFLEATDLAGEIKKALTSLSFEIKTEVRFIPNEAGSGVKPQVKAQSRIKRTSREEPKRRSRRGILRRREDSVDELDDDFEYDD